MDGATAYGLAGAGGCIVGATVTILALDDGRREGISKTCGTLQQSN